MHSKGMAPRRSAFSRWVGVHLQRCTPTLLPAAKIRSLSFCNRSQAAIWGASPEGREVPHSCIGKHVDLKPQSPKPVLNSNTLRTIMFLIPQPYVRTPFHKWRLGGLSKQVMLEVKHVTHVLSNNDYDLIQYVGSRPEFRFRHIPKYS